jgi:hypothetical protein
MTDLSFRVAAFVMGLLLLLAFLQSAARVAIVNRQRGDQLARGIGWVAYSAIARRTLRQRSYDAIQDTLAWVMPVYILLLIMSWFALVQGAFSLLIWSSQAEHSLLQAFIASGSALSTLGFLTPPGVYGQLLAIPEGAFGLGIVVFFFTFIPGYQTTIHARETKVAWLYARAGADHTGFGFIEWMQRSGKANDLAAIWEDWEAWFQALIETHTRMPVLAFVPAVQRGQTWLVGAVVILDAASFCLSVLDAKGLPSAVLCHATGVEALRLIAAEHGARKAVDMSALWECRSDRPSFDAACERMAAMGVPVKSDLDVCWQHFAGLRKEYEASLARLAISLLIPTRPISVRTEFG